MKIAYLSDLDFVGFIPEQENNLRADISWLKTMDMFHIPFDQAVRNVNQLEQFDIVIMNYPKLHNGFMDTYIPFLFDSLKKPKKGMIQHGGYDFFMGWNMEIQSKYLSLMRRSDFFITTNEDDIKKFELLAPKTPIIYFPSELDWEIVSKLDDGSRQDRVMIGGNMSEWYAGTMSLAVAEKFDMPIVVPSMGRKYPDEETYTKTVVGTPVQYLPYLPWSMWYTELSHCKYGVQMMPVAACGTFALACASLKIPCIGRGHLSIQKTCFPELCVDESYSNIDEKVALAKKDYVRLGEYAFQKYQENFVRPVIRERTLKQFEALFK